jgi:hypothetical protein
LAGGGRDAAVVGSRLSGRCPDRRGLRFPVRPPVLAHDGAARTFIGGEVLAAEFVVGGVAALDVVCCGALGRCGVGRLPAGEIGRAQVFAALVHR